MRRATAFRFIALALGLGLAAVPVGWMEWQYRQEEEGSGLHIATDEPGRKYALDASHVGRGDVLNAGGFHDREFERARTPGRTRVALFGDSVSFGSGLHKSSIYPAVAEEMLREEGRDVEIYNFSVYGYDVEQIDATLRYRGWGYDPDLVVYAFFTNDHFPTRLVYVTDDRKPVFIGTDIDEGEAMLSPDLALWLAPRSALFRRFQGARVARIMDEERSSGHRRKGDSDWFEGYFASIVEQAHEHDTPLMVYGLAPHVLADPDMETCGQPVKDGRFCMAQLRHLRRVHRMSWKYGVPFLGSVSWLQQGDQKSYYRSDAPEDPHHSNAEGHRLLALGLADLVRRWMDGEDLLTEPGPPIEDPLQRPRDKKHSRDTKDELEEFRRRAAENSD